MHDLRQVADPLYFVLAVLLVSYLFVLRLQKAPMEDHGHHHNEMDMTMPMYFTNSIHTTLWFKQWTTHTTQSYVLSLIGLVLFGIVHEWLACFRSMHYARINPKTDSSRQRTSLQDRMVLAVLYVVNIATAYLLMLAVMTYNMGYFLAVVAGLGIGYFIFYDKLPAAAANRNDSCHVRLIDDA